MTTEKNELVKATTPSENGVLELFNISINKSTNVVNIDINWWIILIFVVLVAAFLIYMQIRSGLFPRSFEVDEAEFGIGNSKFKLKPNSTDKQIAYAIWVELSTRKIGLPIDFENDVIVEIYDSWFNFFTVTRELIKQVPAYKLRTKSTQKIVNISIEVLNSGLRPHLTRWQARFRHWYERELTKHKDNETGDIIDPQDIQKSFPRYEELRSEMEEVNKHLIRYRDHMRNLIMTP